MNYSYMNSRNYPLVTIAIPTYNRAENYLKQTLESALNQAYPNLEIIVSDNCSPDNTEAMVENYADSRIRYFRQAQGLKPIDNFNFCLNQARGDYFLLFQDDDKIDNDFIEICMKAANYSTDFGIIRTGARIIDSNGNIIKENLNHGEGLSIKDFLINFFSGKIWMFLCSTLFNTKRLREIGGFKSKHNLWADVHAEILLAVKYGRVDVYDIKASFRKHLSQRTFGVNVKPWCEDSIDLLNLMCELTPEKKQLIRDAGMEYFAKNNYNIASQIKSPLKRSITYLIIFKMFEYLYIPPSSGKFYSKTFNFPLRFIRKMKQVLDKGV